MNDPVNLVDIGGRCSSYVPFFGVSIIDQLYAIQNFDWNYQMVLNSMMNSMMSGGINGEQAAATLGGYANTCIPYYYDNYESWYVSSSGGGGNASGGSGNSGKTVITISQDRINTAITLTTKTNCLKFLNDVIDNLTKNVPSLAPVITLTNLQQGIQYATYVNGTTSAVMVPGTNQTVAQYLESRQNTFATVITGIPNTVFINSPLTSYGNISSVLIHEAFHLAVTSPSGEWIGGLSVTDAQLAVAAGIKNSTNPSVDFQNKISDKCK